MVAAFKNFSNSVRALNEMHRVRKPGARVLIIDLRKDVSNEEIENYIQSCDMSPFTSLIMRLTFRHMLRPRAYSKDDLAAMLGNAPFRQYQFMEETIGLEAWLKKSQAA